MTNASPPHDMHNAYITSRKESLAGKFNAFPPKRTVPLKHMATLPGLTDRSAQGLYSRVLCDLYQLAEQRQGHIGLWGPYVPAQCIYMPHG